MVGRHAISITYHLSPGRDLRRPPQLSRRSRERSELFFRRKCSLLSNFLTGESVRTLARHNPAPLRAHPGQQPRQPAQFIGSLHRFAVALGNLGTTGGDDINIPARELGGEADILPATTDGERLLSSETVTVAR